jgi:hypothetical protein
MSYEKNDTDTSLMNTIDKLQSMNDVLLIGGDNSYNLYSDNNVFNMNSLGTPIHRNYYIDASNQFDPNNANSIVISNTFCGKNANGLIDPSLCGLLHNAAGSLERMNIDDDLLETFKVMQREGFDSVEITILTQNGETETKTVSFSDYQSLDSTVFPEGCKRYSKMAHGHCESCDVMPQSSSDSYGQFSNEVNAVTEAATQAQAAQAELDALSAGGVAGMSEGFATRQPLNNYQSCNGGRQITKITYQELTIDDDAITTTYIAGISLLAALIIYKAME